MLMFMRKRSLWWEKPNAYNHKHVLPEKMDLLIFAIEYTRKLDVLLACCFNTQTCL